MKIRNFILVSLMGIALAGCQNATPTESGNPDSADNQKVVTPVVDHGTPYSNGPTTSPIVKGPSSPPPEAQAVTTNENIRLTLPLKK